MTAFDEPAVLGRADLSHFVTTRAAEHILHASDEAETAGCAEIDLRQLRHHTKNTLQRLLSLIAETTDLSSTPAGEQLARELERRIRQSAAVSDALFGVTSSPGSMLERLRMLCGAMVDLMQSNDQVIRVGVAVRGQCPANLREPVVRVANELVGNAVRHGMKHRPSGRIGVRLHSDADRTVLSVTDNGWGCREPLRFGEGLMIAQSFADRYLGTLALDGSDGVQAVLTLPHREALLPDRLGSMPLS